MLFVLFRLGADRFALEAAQVAEVLPLLEIRPLRHIPAGVAGVINYRAAAVPVIDLSAMISDQAAARRLSTRIILVHYPDAHGTPRLLGLIAEKATETIRLEPGDFHESGISDSGAPYLGPIASDPQGLIQWVTVDKLLTPAVRDVLFSDPPECG